MTSALSPSASIKSKRAAPDVRRERAGYILMNVARMPSTIVLVGYFLPYIAVLARMSVGSDGLLSVFGLRVSPTSLPAMFPMVYSFVSMLVCPMIGAIADCSAHRRGMLFTATMGSAVALVLSIFILAHYSMWWLGGVIFVSTLVLSTVADLLMNSYLPEITESDAERSNLSAKAVMLGFLSQVFVAVSIYLAFVYSEQKLSVIGGQFDAPQDASHWSLRRDSFEPLSFNNHTSAPCPDDVCRRIKVPQKIFTFLSSYQLSLSVGSGSCLLQQDRVVGRSLQRRWVRFNTVIRSEQPSGAAIELRLWAVNENDVVLPVMKSGLQPVGRNLQLLSFTVDELPPTTQHLIYEISFESTTGPTTFFIDKLEVMSWPTPGIPIAMVLCGIWYALFIILSIRRLGSRRPSDDSSSDITAWLLISKSFLDLGHRIRRTTHNSIQSRFLLALALYSASAGSSITMATTFFSVEIGLSEGVIGPIMLTTIVFGGVGAVAFSFLGQQTGISRALAFSYGQWIVTLVLTFVLVKAPSDRAWLLLIVPMLGLCFGGSLTLARAVYASMIEPGTEAEMYGLFNLAQVSLGWVATLVFLVTNEVSSSLRHGLLSQTLFLLVAFALQLSIGEKGDVMDGDLVRGSAQ